MPISDDPGRWDSQRNAIAFSLVVLSVLSGPVVLVLEPSQRDSVANWYMIAVGVPALASFVPGPRRRRLRLVVLACALFLLLFPIGALLR